MSFLYRLPRVIYVENNTASSSNISRISKKKEKIYSFTNVYFERAFDPTTDEVHDINEVEIVDERKKPLSIVTNEAYIEKMKVFDPAFSVSCAKKLRTMIKKSCSFNKEALREIFQQKMINYRLLDQ
ncbi:422_t:CDS:2 [Entrophospora sp. SA101]|nr:422_t:CDS:2 [Entrophospora sp. SA101]